MITTTTTLPTYAQRRRAEAETLARHIYDHCLSAAGSPEPYLDSAKQLANEHAARLDVYLREAEKDIEKHNQRVRDLVGGSPRHSLSRWCAILGELAEIAPEVLAEHAPAFRGALDEARERLDRFTAST